MRKAITISISSHSMDTTTLTCELALRLETTLPSSRLERIAKEVGSAVLDKIYKNLPVGSRFNYEMKIGMVQQMILRLAPDNVVAEYVTRAAEMAIGSSILNA